MGNPRPREKRTNSSDDSKFIYGRIGRAGDPARRVKGYLVEANSRGINLDTSCSDGSGRFLLEWPAANSPRSGKVRVRAFTPTRVPSGEKQLDLSELISPYTVVFESRSHRPAVQRRRSIRAHKGKQAHVESLEANGDSPIRVESACQPIDLAWQVRPPPRSMANTMRIDLLEDGTVLGRNLPVKGSLTVARQKSAIYTLVTAARRGRTWESDSKAVVVKRFKTLALSFEGDLLTESDILAGVQVTCPAPAGGLKVTIASSDARVMSGGEVRIEAGETYAPAVLRSRARRGYVELTALADGHLRDTVKLMVKEKPSSME